MPRTPRTTRAKSSQRSASSGSRDEIREHAFREADLRLEPTSQVIVTGPLSRTWYADQATLQDLFEWMQALGIVPTIVSNSAFLYTARIAAQRVAGASLSCVLEDSPQAAPVLSAATFCVAYVGRNGTDLVSAGPVAVQAFERGVPILALHLNGHAEFFHKL